MQSQSRRTFIAVIVLILLAGVVAWWQAGFSLQLSRFFAAEITPTPTLSVEATLTPGPPLSFTLPTPPPGAVRCASVGQTHSVNTAVPFTATGGSAPYTWFAADQGAPTSAGNGTALSFTFSTPGTKQILVQSPRTSGVSDVDVCTITVTQ